jgi:hypothetical protein
VLVGATGPPGITNVQITQNAITQNHTEGSDAYSGRG